MVHPDCFLSNLEMRLGNGSRSTHNHSVIDYTVARTVVATLLHRIAQYETRWKTERDETTDVLECILPTGVFVVQGMRLCVP
jgi:hypothetical protein